FKTSKYFRIMVSASCRTPKSFRIMFSASVMQNLQVVQNPIQRVLPNLFRHPQHHWGCRNKFGMTLRSQLRLHGKIPFEAEWKDYFIQESAKAQELKARIKATDQEINLMVYQLYELTEEEIGMVEKI